MTAWAVELEWIGEDGEGHGGRSREEEGEACLIKYGGPIGCGRGKEVAYCLPDDRNATRKREGRGFLSAIFN